MLPNYLWDPVRTNVQQPFVPHHLLQQNSDLLLAPSAEVGTSSSISPSSKGERGSSASSGCKEWCRAWCKSVALTLPRTAIYVNLLVSPLALTLALEVAVLNTRLWEERARIATRLAFVFGLQEALAYLTCRLLTTSPSTSSSSTSRSLLQRHSATGLVGGLRLLLQEVGASVLCMIGLLASAVGTLLTIRGAKFLEEHAMLYWVAGYGVLSGLGNGLVLAANTFALQHTPHAERRYLRGSHCLVGCVLALVLPPLHALLYSAFGIVAVLRASVALQLVELPFLLLWPSPTANAAVPADAVLTTASNIPLLPDRAPISYPEPDQDLNQEPLQGIVTDAGQLPHKTASAEAHRAAAHMSRAVAMSGGQPCRGRPLELSSLLLVALAQGLVLVHFGKYMQLHFPGSSIALAASLHVVAFLVAEYFCNVLETDVARYLNVKQLRTVSGVLIAYSVPLLGFLPVLIEYQPYFLLPVAFYVLLGIIWGAVAAMRARLQELATRTARSHHHQHQPQHDASSFSASISSTFSTHGEGSVLSGVASLADAAGRCGLNGEAAVVALAMLVGPALGGLTLDANGTYRDACFWSAALTLVGSVLLCCVRAPRARRRDSLE